MFALLLQWLRNSVKAAFLGGIEDALKELEVTRADGGTIEQPADILPSLRARFTLAAAPVVAEPTPEPVVATNGRRNRSGT